MWDTRGHWNMKMKGKKKEKRIETVTMDALPFNGCSLLFFFSLKYRRRRFAFSVSFRIRMKSVILNVGSKNILQWIFHLYCRIRISRDYFISPQFFRCTILWKGWFNEIYSSFWESYRWRVKIYFREKLTF